MGCISSKGMGRSMSIHERFNQGFHALAIGEDFHMTTRERDRIITLIKIASRKSLTGFRYVEAETETDETTKPCTSVKTKQDGKGRTSQVSESTQLPEISNGGQNAAIVTEPFDEASTSARCRSFHTLEEFEELIEKVKLFEARIVENAQNEVESEPVANSESDSLETCERREDNKQDDIPLATASKKVIEAVGWRRKAMARELESLMLPSSAKAELTSVGSLKEWIHAGDDIYSPETYVTPKFGSYAMEHREFGLFSPELVAAFEECMQQMEEEEVALVKQMEQSFTC